MTNKRSEHDRRSVRISLTEKGMEICEMIDALYDEHLDEMLKRDVFDIDTLRASRNTLRDIERFWTDQLRYT